MSTSKLIKLTTSVIIIAVFTTHAVFGATGSNMGGYGTNFSPATLTGQVTDEGGSPVSGASVSTIAGHSTTSGSDGSYTLNIDAPGIYTVTAESGGNSVTQQIEVSLGSTTILNLQIGTSTTTPDVKANGSDVPITLGTGDTLLVNVSLVAGSNLGVDCDWWVAAETPFGWYYLDAGTMSWAYAGDSYTDLSPTYQGPLFDLSPFEVLNMSDLPAGSYTLYFAVDTNRNGVLNLDELFFDSVVVNITP